MVFFSHRTKRESPAGDQSWKFSCQCLIFGCIGDQWVAISSPVLGRFCRPHLFMTETTILLTASLSFKATVTGKIVETYSNRVTSENKRIHTPLCPLHSKWECLLFSKGSLNSDTTLHGGDVGGKAIFYPFEVRKMSKSPFRAKCLNSFCWRL